MARRSELGQRLHVSADKAHADRLEKAAIVAGTENGKSIPASELHRRAMPALLACVESCTACRAGTCDGLVHVRKDEPGHEPKIEKKTEQTTVPEFVEQNDKIVAVGDIERGQVYMFKSAPVVAKIPEPTKRARKPVVITSESPAFARVCAKYQELFEREKKTKPKFGAREGKTIRELLERYDAETLLRMLEKAFSNPWWVGKKGTILAFALDPDQHAGTTVSAAPSAIQGGRDDLPW